MINLPYFITDLQELFKVDVTGLHNRIPDLRFDWGFDDKDKAIGLKQLEHTCTGASKEVSLFCVAKSYFNIKVNNIRVAKGRDTGRGVSQRISLETGGKEPWRAREKGEQGAPC